MENHSLPVLDTTIVARYDVVIIGGGIAGVAIAELLSRLTDLQILVIEREERLGMKSSGRLEGWYHTGALYAVLQDPQTLLTCTNSIKDLYNLYTPHKHFNGNLVKVNEVISPRIKRTKEYLSERWFNPQPVHYILPLEEAPDFERTAKRPLDRFPLWQQQRELMTQRLKNCFIKHNWSDENGYCQAPTIQDIEDKSPVNSAEGVDGGLELFEAKANCRETLNDLCRNYNQGKPSSYEIFRSLDCSMNTERILKDLVVSSLASKRVVFETGAEIEEVISVNRGTIKSIVYRKGDGVRVHAKADLFVITAGANTLELSKEGNFPLLKKVKTVKSAMVVVKPAIAKINFARMALDPHYHFNHFYREFIRDDVHYDYSLLADSGSIEGDGEASSQSAEHILEQAERYFGRDKLYSKDADIYEYSCAKTEFISSSEEERQYSYWVEHETGENYIYILPGKFSLFPAATLQAYRRIVQKKCLGTRQEVWPSLENVKSVVKSQTVDILNEYEIRANSLVAQPYPQSIVMQDSYTDGKARYSLRDF